MIVAITGASGLLGMALCQQLLQESVRIRVLVHQNAYTLDAMPVEQIRGTLDDVAILDRLCAGADVVFHLAGRISIGQVHERELRQTNVVGTENVLTACQRAGVKRLIHFSSVHAYRAVPHNLVFDETAEPAYAYPYERTKAQAQALVLEANGRQGLETLCLNPTAVLGPWDYQPSLQGQMILDLLQGRIPVLSPGGFDWVDSRDVALAAKFAMQKGRPGEAYLISGQYATMIKLASLIGQISERKMPARTLPFWFLKSLTPLITGWSRISNRNPLFTLESLSHVESGHPQVSHAKATHDLGYRPRPLEETIRDVYDWYLKQYLA